MANEILNRADVICQLLGKRERLPDQSRDPLSQGTVESLDVIGDAPLFIDDLMLMVWNDFLIRTPAIGIERGVLPVALGYGLPKCFGTLTTPVTDVVCNDLPTLDIESYPYPLFVGFLADKAEHFIDFELKCIDGQLFRFGFDLEIQVIGQLAIEIHHES